MLGRHAVTAAIGGAALAMSLSACTAAPPASVTPPASPAPSTAEDARPFNDQDVMFAQMMSIHHSGAMSMSQVLLNKEDIDPAVRELAQKIMDAQGPEIAIMNAWLEEWGMADEPIDDMSGMDHSTMDLSELEAATGVEATRLFLEQMIEHHQGAVDMSDVEVATGANAESVALAEKIIADQQAEITLMQKMLSDL